MVASGAEARVLVVTRHVVAPESAAAFLADARRALAALATCPGYRSGSVARSADDARWYLIQSRWADVGSYRRALSAYDVRVSAIPLLSGAIDEPSAYEVLHDRLPDGVTDRVGDRAADADEVGLGHAGGPDVPRLPS
jgi:hypothetical protein